MWKPKSESFSISTGFPGDKTPIIRGSGLKALEAKSVDDEWVKPVLELAKTLDEYIPDPVRPTDKPFLMPIEDIFSIEGRGTVCTGRIERGIVKVNEEVEVVGLGETKRRLLPVLKCSTNSLMKAWPETMPVFS